jgi:hypothetical protein
MGYVEKSIVKDGDGDYFAFAITPGGIDYILENEQKLREATAAAAISQLNDDDADIPF